MIDRLEQIDKRYQELEEQIMAPEVATDPKKLQKLAREKASIEDVVARYREYRVTSDSLQVTRAMLDDGPDEEMKVLVKQEIEDLESKLEGLQEEMKIALLPRDENDKRDIIMEIRAGTGGNEAGLFAADLFRMYSRYAQSKHWDV
ncbi:PCRF domain-containing protein, partial [Chloroflexota bacterium]